MSPLLFIVAAIVMLGALNAGSSYFVVERNAGGMELLGLMRWAAVPAVIAATVRRRQHDALTASAQLAGILVGAELLGLGLLWPLANHPTLNVATLMGAGLGDGVSLSMAAVPIGSLVIWGVRRFGDRRVGRRE
jgi:hypothetical protein